MVADRQSAAGEERATTTPSVVIEVLSASTDDEHHVEKLARYARRETLGHHAVFEQTRPRAYLCLWTRSETGWPDAPEVIERIGAVIALPAVAARLALADIYR